MYRLVSLSPDRELLLKVVLYGTAPFLGDLLISPSKLRRWSSSVKKRCLKLGILYWKNTNCIIRFFVQKDPIYKTKQQYTSEVSPNNFGIPLLKSADRLQLRRVRSFLGLETAKIYTDRTGKTRVVWYSGWTIYTYIMLYTYYIMLGFCIDPQSISQTYTYCS